MRPIRLLPAIGLVLYAAGAVTLLVTTPPKRFLGLTSDEWAAVIVEEVDVEGPWPTVSAMRFKAGGLCGTWIFGYGASVETGNRLAEGGADALPILLDLLEHEDPRLRAEAACLLARLEETARPARRALRGALRDEDASVRGAAALALGECGIAERDGPVLRRLLQRGAPHAALALGTLGPPDDAIEPLRRALRSQPAEVARYAAWALGCAGDRARPAVPDLVKLLENGEFVPVVADALRRIGPAAREAVPHLIAAASATEGAARRGLLQALGEIGDPHALGILLDALGDGEDRTRGTAIHGLARLEGPPAEAVAGLIRALGDAAKENRAGAAHEIGRLETSPPSAAAALRALLDDEGEIVRVNAAVALARITKRPEEVIPVLEAVRRSVENPFVRRAAEEALERVRVD